MVCLITDQITVIGNVMNVLTLRYFCTSLVSIECLRGKVIQVKNSTFFCLCHFGKVKYIGNNILKYLSHSLKKSKLINQNIFFHFKNWYFSSMVKWSKSISLYRDISSWISLPLRHTENDSWNVMKHPYIDLSMPCQSLPIFYWTKIMKH